MSFELLPFQARVAEQIARRYQLLAEDGRRPMEHRDWPTPYYQALAAITGSGKTAILADAVAQIRGSMSVEPIILWISKAKAVVDQTFSNFEPGGKYEQLIDGFLVSYLSELDSQRIRDSTQPLIAITTVGAFNQKDKGDGTLRVHKTEQDSNSAPLWQVLAERSLAPGRRRPLIIVYDEAQNLADQQVDLLLELEPDALLVASATLKTPGKLGRVVDRLKEAGWSDEALDDTGRAPQKSMVTAIRSLDAVEAGLVKRQIILGGYSTEMESALGDMMADFRSTTAKATKLQAGFLPKAIYVCRTNISQEDGVADNPHQPFKNRRAPPIAIWRYLVEQAGIDPTEIAVYCDLRLDRKHYPPPASFILFSGGEDDFAAFSAGKYRHIIFNQSLQEGWDDPSCCFAYIDKSMGSTIQVEQVIGRVLRQPGAVHHADPDLNTANFYIRIDDRQEFQKTLKTVQLKVSAEMPEVKIEGFSESRERRKLRRDPKRVMRAPEIHIDSDQAIAPLQTVIAGIHDYTRDSANVVGPGERTRIVQIVGGRSIGVAETEAREHSNRVVARWLIRRTMQSLFPEAVKTVDWADYRFEARVELTSRAANQLRQDAEKLVDTFLANAELSFEDANPYSAGTVIVRPDQLNVFRNAVHEGYSDLNPVELEFARAIDDTGLTWARNPSNGGYSIPLLEKGGSRRFYPDFLVWKDELVYAIDPKGKHLLSADATRKLLAIRDENGKQRVIVRLISDGRWTHEPIKQVGPAGWTVWRLSTSGQLRCTHHATPDEAVRKALELRAP
jgi:type III restriction enzyme